MHLWARWTFGIVGIWLGASGGVYCISYRPVAQPGKVIWEIPAQFRCH